MAAIQIKPKMISNNEVTIVSGVFTMLNQSNALKVYDCEIQLRFRLIEDRTAVEGDPDRLLDMLLEAFSCGEDGYMETTHVSVDATPLGDTEVSPAMRQQLLRLRNVAA